MAFNKLEDANALLLYRVGPVLMCSPTLQVESVIVPPAVSRASAVSDAEPGMFRSMYGMVRVVDLRVRFGVDVSQYQQPGKIIIVEVSGGHAGFWVDEIEDVVAFPQTGWSQIPSHVPRSVFSRALMQDGGIRLYAEFDRLDGFKASGYLREHIRSLQRVASMQDKAPPGNSRAPTPLSMSSKTSALPTASFGDTNTAIASSISPPTSSPLESAEIAGAKSAARQSNDSQHTAVNQAVSAQHKGVHHRPAFDKGLRHASAHQSTAGGRARTPHKAEGLTQHQLPPVPTQHAEHRAAVSSSDSDSLIASFTHQAGGADSNGLQTQVAPSTAEAERTGARWVWWFVSLLLVFMLLFMFMQNSRLLQTLIAQNEPPASQSRVDLQQDAVVLTAEKNSADEFTQYAPSTPSINASTSTTADIEVNSAAVAADGLTDVIYIDADSGNLTITVNDYEEDSTPENKESDDKSSAGVSAQSQITMQSEAGRRKQELQQMTPQEHDAERQYETEKQSQPLPEDITDSAESMHTDTEQQALSIQAVEREVKKSSSAETGISDRATVQSSRRLQHIVVKGDTLWSITGRYINKPWRYPEIARLSGIDNPHLIYPGQRVIIVLNYKNRSD